MSETVAAWGTLTQAREGYGSHNWGVHELPAAAGTSRQLQQTGACSLWWECLAVPAEAGAGMWGQWWPRPPHASQQWCPTFQAVHASSRGIPSCASPHSCPHCYIRAAYNTPLPGSVLPTPHFSTQPQPASADSHPRQGSPGLIPKEALGWAALRPLEPTWAEETLA